VTLGDSNYMAFGKTAYSDDTNVGFWLGVNANVAQFNIGDGSNYMKWDGASLLIAGTLSILGGSGISNLTDAGALATKDAADYTTDVTGTKPPADADNTQNAVQTGLTLTSGEIRRGTDEILLDFNNRRMTVGSETYQNNGIQLEHNAGLPRAYIGDGGAKYIKYDGTDLIVGPLTTIKGVPSINDGEFNAGETLLFKPQDVTFRETLSANGTFITFPEEVQLYVPGNLNAEQAKIEKVAKSYFLENITYGQYTYVFVVDFNASTLYSGNYLAVGNGYADDASPNLGAWLEYSQGTKYAVVHDGVTRQAQDLGTYSGAERARIKIVAESDGTVMKNVYFYENGTLVATFDSATYSLPSHFVSDPMLVVNVKGLSGNYGALTVWVYHMAYSVYKGS